MTTNEQPTNEQRPLDITSFRGVDVDPDVLFDVLSHPRRRFVVASLRDHSRPVALADVAGELTRWETDMPTDQIRYEQVRSRYTALHHVHVPKMEDGGLVEYDRDRRTVALVDDRDGTNVCELVRSVD